MIRDYEPLTITAQRLKESIEKMGEVLKHAPKGCICHVVADDGYHGVDHSQTCLDYTEAWKALESLFEPPPSKL